MHLGRLTWKRKIIFQTIILRFHVNLPGCNLSLNVVCWGYNPLVLTFDPNFLKHPSSNPHKTAGTKGQYPNFWYRHYLTRLGDSSFDRSPPAAALDGATYGGDFPVAAVPHEHVSKHATFCLAKQSLLKSGLTGNSKANVFTYHGGTKMVVCATNALPERQLKPRRVISAIYNCPCFTTDSLQVSRLHIQASRLQRKMGCLCTPWTWECPAML